MDFGNELNDLDGFDSIDWDNELPDGIRFDEDTEGQSESSVPSPFRRDSQSEYSTLAAKKFGSPTLGQVSRSRELSPEWQSEPGNPVEPINSKRDPGRRKNGVARTDRRSDNTSSLSQRRNGRDRSGSRGSESITSTEISGQTGRRNGSNENGTNNNGGLTGAELKILDDIKNDQTVSRDFSSATFSCYLKGSKFTPDGEMEIVMRIPAQDIFEGMKLAFAYQKILTCQILKRQQ